MEAEEAKSYIHEVSKTIRNLRKRIRKNVVQVCKLLEMLEEKCRPRECEDLPEDLRNSLRRHFRDIFWSLKLHLVLHAEVQPVAEDQPAGEDQPDAEDQPAAEDKPAAEDQPDAEDKPDAEDQPAAEDQPDAHQMLQKMARWELMGLKDDEIEAAPDEKSIIDPGSKILEIVSRHFRKLFNILCFHSGTHALGEGVGYCHIYNRLLGPRYPRFFPSH